MPGFQDPMIDNRLWWTVEMTYTIIGVSDFNLLLGSGDTWGGPLFWWRSAANSDKKIYR
jgi:hypothetical protein